MVSNQSWVFPIWNTQKQQYSTVLHPQTRNAGIVTLLTNLLSGIVRNRVWHSTESSSYATDLILNHVNSHPANKQKLSGMKKPSQYGWPTNRELLRSCTEARL
jgi:hypothetical protein